MSKKTFSNIAREIVAYRNEKGYSQNGLGTALGFPNGQIISNIERGLCSLSPERIAKVPESEWRKTLMDAIVDDYVENITREMRVELLKIGDLI